MMHSMSLSLVPVHGEVVVGTAVHSVGARLMKGLAGEARQRKFKSHVICTFLFRWEGGVFSVKEGVT